MISRPLSAGVALASRALPAGLQVVLYHHLADEDDHLTEGLGIRTAPALFEAHLRTLERDYEIVDLDMILSGRLPRRALLITFDDGYRSVVDIGGPILHRLGLPSVFFISSAFVTPGSLPFDNLLCLIAGTRGVAALEEAVTDRPATGRTVNQLIGLLADLPFSEREPLADRLAEQFRIVRPRVRTESGLFLDCSELRSLSSFGCEIGNHTRSHLFCRTIDDAAAADLELGGHKRRLEEWAGVRVRAFSYPYGNKADATPFVESELSRSGHEATFLVESRPNAKGRTGERWNRVSLDAAPLSNVGLRLEVLPRLRAVKDALGHH